MWCPNCKVWTTQINTELGRPIHGGTSSCGITLMISPPLSKDMDLPDVNPTAARIKYKNSEGELMVEKPELFKLNINKKTVNQIKYAQIGIIIMMIGIILSVGINGFGPRGKSDWAGERGDLDVGAIQGIYFGRILYYFGIMILCLSLLSIALQTKELHIHLRVGLLITMGLIIASIFSASYFF